MKPIFLLLAFALFLMTSSAQNKIRSLEELINKSDPGWVLVKQWIDSAKNKVEILPADIKKAEDALVKLQVTTRSPMGAIVYMTGGLLVDRGWIRILGSGSAKLGRSLPDWTTGKTLVDSVETSGFLLIADDVIGGFFILNGGIFSDDIGKVFYFSPDNLEFEALDLTYSEFLLFCFNNDLNKFYEGYRWKNWEQDVAGLGGDKVYNFYPPLWSKEGKDLNSNSRKAVPIEEQFGVNIRFRKQLGLDK